MAFPASVRQKIIWADHHRELLIAEINRYFESKPCTLMPNPDSENNSVWRVRYDNPIPPSIALIAGDFVQNLRSSLDYLVWELILAFGQEPCRKNMFPICDSFESFQEQLSRHRLDGMADDAKAEIERLQPYNDGAEIKPLRVIENLSVRNRHRRLLLTILKPNPARTDAIIQANLNFGAVEVKSHILFHIAMNERTTEKMEIGMYFLGLYKYVTEIALPRFEKFF